MTGPLIWGLVAGSEWGQRGAFLLFSFFPLLVLPFCIVLLVRLRRRTGEHLSTFPQLLPRAVQAIALTGAHREKLLQQVYGRYTSASATTVTLAGSAQHTSLTLSKNELHELLVDTFFSARRAGSGQESRSAAEEEQQAKRAAYWFKKQLPTVLEHAGLEKTNGDGFRFENFSLTFPVLLEFLLGLPEL